MNISRNELNVLLKRRCLDLINYLNKEVYFQANSEKNELVITTLVGINLMNNSVLLESGGWIEPLWLDGTNRIKT